MDAKFGFDDNAEFRQKDIFALRDLSQEDQGEVDAAKYGLNFISEFLVFFRLLFLRWRGDERKLGLSEDGRSG